MRRTIAGFWWSPTTEGNSALVVTATFFTLGGLLGCLAALRTAGSGAEAMGAYLEQFLTVAQAGGLEQPALPSLFWRALRWPLAAFLFGFSALGVLGLPLLNTLRGFFLAFSIAAFGCAYGRGGLAVAFLLLGLPGLAAIPAFLVLSTQSFSAAASLAGRAGGQGRREWPYHQDYFFRCGVCGVGVCLSLLLERYLVPVLLTGAAGALIR